MNFAPTWQQKPVRNFLKIADFDPIPVLAALYRQPELWNQNTLRTRYPESPHHAVDDIWLFFNATDDTSAVPNEIQVEAYPPWSMFPQLRPIIFDLMRRVEGVQLGRVIITRLPPGKSITPHADAGAPVEWYSRFQLCLQSAPGCTFRCGDEVIQMRGGEVWRFDNRLEHEVVNASAEDRLAVVVDIRCA